MPRFRLDYENPFEMLAHIIDIAKDVDRGLVSGSLLITTPSGLSEENYPIAGDKMFYLSFVVGYKWVDYQTQRRNFYLHADTDEDLVYMRLKLEPAQAKRVRLPL